MRPAFEDRYQIRLGTRSENHSSSGVIVSTGLGSTGWLKSLLTGAMGVARAAAEVLHPSLQPPPRRGEKVAEVGAKGGSVTRAGVSGSVPATEFAWNADYLLFTVREPFPTRTTGASSQSKARPMISEAT